MTSQAFFCFTSDLPLSKRRFEKRIAHRMPFVEREKKEKRGIPTGKTSLFFVFAQALIFLLRRNFSVNDWRKTEIKIRNSGSGRHHFVIYLLIHFSHFLQHHFFYVYSLHSNYTIYCNAQKSLVVRGETNKKEKTKKNASIFRIFHVSICLLHLLSLSSLRPICCHQRNKILFRAPFPFCFFSGFFFHFGFSLFHGSTTCR